MSYTNTVIDSVPAKLKPHLINLIKKSQENPGVSLAVLVHGYSSGKKITTALMNIIKYPRETRIGKMVVRPRTSLTGYNKVLLRQLINFKRTC